MYIDGQLYHSKNGALAFLGQNADLSIGSGRDGFYKGYLDEFKIFSRILTQNEIDSLGAATTCKEIELDQGGLDTLKICKGDSIKLNGKTSMDNTYFWSPHSNLINFSSSQPTAFPNSNQLYVLSYRNDNNQLVNDSFFVEVVDSVPNIIFNDTLLCTGGTKEIDISNQYDVIWSDGSLLNRRSISQAGSYELEVKNDICIKNFNFKISTQENPKINIDGDLIVCEGEKTDLSVTSTPDDFDFIWVNEGLEKVKNRSVPAGFYKVYGYNECGDAADSILIEEFVFDEINYNSIYENCIGDTVIVDFSNLNKHVIEWNDGNVDFVRKFTERGSYQFTISEDKCELDGSFDVFFISSPYLNIDSHFSLCKGVEITITPVDYSGRILWDNQYYRDNFIVLNRTTPLPVIIENNCGVDSMVINFKINDCNCYIFFPNAFTPNDDGINDVFRPIVNCDNLVSYQLTIFNQWGEKIFKTLDPSYAWDGTYKNKPLDKGVYFYYVDYVDNINNIMKRTYHSGTISVIY